VDARKDRMRRLILKMGVSIDGFVARVDALEREPRKELLARGGDLGGSLHVYRLRGT
jgi:hypothetical protein